MAQAAMLVQYNEYGRVLLEQSIYSEAMTAFGEAIKYNAL